MKENIGNVCLDYTFYGGQDLYSDGDVEDEILNIVKDYDEKDFDSLISEKSQWPILYHLARQRANVIDWIPITKNDTVLEIGAGCGALTGNLAGKAKNVTCIELSKRRSMINALRNKEYDNINILVGNFQNIEPKLEERYDYITLIGVLEYAKLYIDSENPYVDFLKMMKRHLNKNGKIIIAIENKFGLKYWAGCQEDHIPKYFVGLQGYDCEEQVRTFGKKELTEICKSAELGKIDWYYPYPDYKFANAIYSDIYMPQAGELKNNIRNFDKERYVFFDETKVFDEIIAENQFPFFANSFLLIVDGGSYE